MALSAAAAWVLTRYVDDPMRSWEWANARAWRKGVVVGTSLLAALLPLLGVNAYLSYLRDASLSADRKDDDPQFPGAGALMDSMPREFTADPDPGPLALDSQWASFPDGCSERANELFSDRKRNSSCSSFGDASMSDARVMIVGDSHAEQNIIPQIQPFLTYWNMSAEALLQGACPFGAADFYKDGCRQRNADVMTYIDEDPPDYLFLIVTAASPDSPDETLVAGAEDAVRELTARGVTVVGLRDNLRSEDNLYECSSERDPQSPFGGCLLQRSDYFAEEDPGLSLTGIDGFHYIDMTDAYCTEDVCPTIVGNVHVYLDHNHLTETYSSTVAPYFTERLSKQLGLG